MSPVRPAPVLPEPVVPCVKSLPDVMRVRRYSGVAARQRSRQRRLSPDNVSINVAEVLMLIVISPAKPLDFDAPLPAIRATQPRLLDQSQALVDRARQLSASDIPSLMKDSDMLAAHNVARFINLRTQYTRDMSRTPT